MDIESRTGSTQGSPEFFTGDVWVNSIAAPKFPGQRAIAALVRFAPCARAAWHSPAGDPRWPGDQGIPRTDHLHPAGRGALAWSDAGGLHVTPSGPGPGR